jgi:hypothetical protein
MEVAIPGFETKITTIEDSFDAFVRGPCNDTEVCTRRRRKKFGDGGRKRGESGFFGGLSKILVADI